MSMPLEKLAQLDQRLFQQQPVVQHLEIDVVQARERLALCLPAIPRVAAGAKPLVVSILRLDQLHPEISGNKWPKLRGWFYQLLRQGYIGEVASMGGAHSNHLLAFAAVAKALGLACCCYVRANGEAEQLSATQTTTMLLRLGARVVPVSRTAFRQLRHSQHAASFCPEGGKSDAGVLGVVQWLEQHRHLFSKIGSIYTGVGTGTWLSGLVCGLVDQPSTLEIHGIPAVAGQKWLENDIHQLIGQYIIQHQSSPKNSQNGPPLTPSWRLCWDYPQQAFGPVSQQVWQTMAAIVPVPLDQVYLPRVLCILLLEFLNPLIDIRKPIMVIHSGGLRP